MPSDEEENEENNDEESVTSEQEAVGLDVEPPVSKDPSSQISNSCKLFLLYGIQLRDKTLLDKTEIIQSGKTRCFVPSWYDQFKWLHFCQSRLNFFAIIASSKYQVVVQ